MMKRINLHKGSPLRIGRHSIDVTHPDKVLFPRDTITKADLITYYQKISSLMLPYLHNRPLTLHRYVDGIQEEGFYQKDAADYFPRWIQRIAIKKKEGSVTHYVVANKSATLVYLANQCTITYHTWLSKIDRLDIPDKLIFDLDPAGTASFGDVRFVAQKIYDYCMDRAVTPFCMTTGSRGVHIVIPLRRQYDFDTVRAVAKTVAEHLAAEHPTRITTATHIKERKNNVYIDVLRNAYAQTAVAPYSVRAREHAPVATPITWDDLFNGTIKKSDQFTIQTVMDYAKSKDPWSHFLKTHNALARLN